MLSVGSASAAAIAGRSPAPPAPTMATSTWKVSMEGAASAGQHQLLVQTTVVGLPLDGGWLQLRREVVRDLVVPQVHGIGLEPAEHARHQQAQGMERKGPVVGHHE